MHQNCIDLCMLYYCYYCLSFLYLVVLLWQITRLFCSYCYSELRPLITFSLHRILKTYILSNFPYKHEIKGNFHPHSLPQIRHLVAVSIHFLIVQTQPGICNKRFLQQIHNLWKAIPSSPRPTCLSPKPTKYYHFLPLHSSIK